MTFHHRLYNKFSRTLHSQPRFDRRRSGVKYIIGTRKSGLSQAHTTLMIYWYPANKKRSVNVGTMLGQRRRRWTSIVPTLAERFIMATGGHATKPAGTDCHRGRMRATKQRFAESRQTSGLKPRLGCAGLIDQSEPSRTVTVPQTK